MKISWEQFCERDDLLFKWTPMQFCISVQFTTFIFYKEERYHERVKGCEYLCRSVHLKDAAKKKNSFDTSENIPMKMASDFDFDFVKSSLSHFWGPSSGWECFHIEASGPPKLDALLSGSCIPESDKVKFWFQTVTKLYSLYIHMSDQNPNWNS